MSRTVLAVRVFLLIGARLGRSDSAGFKRSRK
jgi:hypothetical protein